MSVYKKSSGVIYVSSSLTWGSLRKKCGFINLWGSPSKIKCVVHTHNRCELKCGFPLISRSELYMYNILFHVIDLVLVCNLSSDLYSAHTYKLVILIRTTLCGAVVNLLYCKCKKPWIANHYMCTHFFCLLLCVSLCASPNKLFEEVILVFP